ncbi:MAG: YeeE/YedE thiosulfate transporter family protein [Pseudomonadota bacterium]
MEAISDGGLAALCGLGAGAPLGLAARLGRFCTLGAIEDALYGGDRARLLMWPLAIAVAAAVTALAAAGGWAAPAESLYLSTAWNPAASLIGGLAFGYGMALAGNCGFGALARLGGGDMRSFVIVLVTGISAYAALSGPFARLREALFPIRRLAPGETPDGFAHIGAEALGLSPTVVALALAGGLAAAALGPRELRRAPQLAVWAAVAGLAVAAGWIGTSLVAARAFEPVAVASHSFTRPLGDSILWVMTASGGGLGFAVGSVGGVLAGAVLGSLWEGRFRWEACDDPAELKRQAAGGVLMGMGGVVALGCSVGQGLTAFSVLALSAPVTAAAIFAGAALGLRQLIRGFQPG